MTYDDAVADATLTSGHSDDAPEPSGKRPTSGSVCDRCGRVHPRGRFMVGCPGPQLRDGRRSLIVQAGGLPSQAEAAAALADKQREVEADLGGELAQLKRDTIRDIMRLDMVSEFLFTRLLNEGPLTGRGRTRAALTAYLKVVHELSELRRHVGLDRRERHVDPLERVRQAVAEVNR